MAFLDSQYFKIVEGAIIAINSKNKIPWSQDSADDFNFFAEILSENEITISLSIWQLNILQCGIDKGQEVLKSLA